ncbi:putative bifunctional diguanylate cyclase/phosphodiesterase [Spongisporangium articulatum]|uniref:Bifunctional diguanylate cyclase/phosphodiesterase n=1 Tax=Spongisporangium articulatum TaxID=3362603 RepID=A0ABW8AT64_9ACTN
MPRPTLPRFTFLRSILIPRGVALPESVWRQRHGWVTNVLLLHLPVLALWSLYLGTSPTDVAPLSLTAVLWALARIDLVSGGRVGLNRGFASAAASAGLMSCAAYLVSVSGGYIEAHFHFFVLLPVVTLYEAWTPFLVAIGIVLVDHGLVGTVWPHAVFGHSMMQTEHPWRFACVHAFFVTLAGLGSLVTWRLAEAGRLDQQRLIDQLHFRATHDGLTGLANREALANAMRVALMTRPDERLSVLLLDLDRFKEVNDTLGHAAGDELLQVLSAEIAAALARRAKDALLVRLGGDEFAVLLHSRNEVELRNVAQEIAVVTTSSVEVAGVPVSVGVSIGVATYTGPHGLGRDAKGIEKSAEAAAEGLLRHADVAMYQAKAAGETLAFYEPATDENARERLNVLNDLREALAARDQILLHYQPKVSLPDARIIGVEALARWAHPRRGMLPPSEFVALAQTTEHAERFTRLVIDVAARQAAAWRDRGWQVPVAVNVTPRNLLRDEFVDFVAATLGTYGIPASLLRIEITEDAIVADPVAAIAVLTELHQLGISVSIDDFGTGFSSLSYLRHLRVDELKIDRSFVNGLGTTAAGGGPEAVAGADEVLVTSIIELGHSLGLHVVAEGVEQQHEADVLTQLGCDSAQGFLYFRPMPADQLTKVLAGGDLVRNR